MEIWQHIWQVLAALGGTLALIFVLAFAAKRVQRSTTVHGQRLSVVETLHLSTKERLLLVQVGEQQVLLGVTGQHITQLAQLPSQLQSDADQPMLSDSEIAGVA